MNDSVQAVSQIYQVAIPSPLRRLFDYRAPQHETTRALPGCRVTVPFGKRQVVGIVVASTTSSTMAPAQLKSIVAVLDAEPIFPPALLELLQWAAGYYHCPLGEALHTALPAQLRTGKPLPSETWWRLTHFGQGLPENALPGAPRQQQAFGLVQRAGEISGAQLAESGISAAILRTLASKQLLEAFQKPCQSQTSNSDELLRETPLALLPDQQKALDQQTLQGFHAYLIEGETGSGKTEVYLQSIARILRNGRQALVLVPEISLTPQMVQRFRARFNRAIAVIHSALSEGERLLAWQAAANGSASIIIGTRSAVFAPLHNPGIIIVDEEHDASFKQQDGFRYSARDVAVMRARRLAIPVVLGSATPSLESVHNCRIGRYHQQRLKGRPGGASQPRWQLVDIRKANLNTGFSAPVIDAIAEHLADGNQVLVFLNRRGYAPTLLCHDCGWLAQCPHCDARLTYHQGKASLLCHHCEYRAPVPHHCPACQGHELQFLGQGTERSESVLEALFPQVPILRVDRDSTRRKNAFTEVIDELNTGSPCILVGTQMLSKGHHFPGVTLVIVVDADSSLHSADFRGTERMGQLITQVAGRAGRGDSPGRVMIQSHYCDHPLFASLVNHRYDRFAEQLLGERQTSAMPPFANLALLRAEASDANNAHDLLTRSRKFCESLVPPAQDFRYVGPYPAPLERRNRRFRFQLQLICEQRTPLHKLLNQLSAWLETNPAARRVRWSIDIDPQDMS